MKRRLSEGHSWIAMALAAIAGSVDGIGYLLLARLFTSGMSGNTVAMTIYVASRNWHEAWRYFEPIVAFFAGVVFGLLVTELLSHVRYVRIFSVVAGLEIVLLLVFLLLAHPASQWMVIWPAAAMGIQNALLRAVGDRSVRTTFITGMLAEAANELVSALKSALKRDGNARRRLRDFLFYGGIWFSFAAGGIIGAFIDLKYGAIALLLPIFALTLLVLFDLMQPPL